MSGKRAKNKAQSPKTQLSTSHEGGSGTASRSRASSGSANSILGLQHHAGNQAVGQMLHKTGRGQPLDTDTRQSMESHFREDFSKVRLHTDGQAAESARALNAQAYTVGQDIVLGSGGYAPHTAAGRRLLAHELTHVVQQSGTSHTHSDTTKPGESEVLGLSSQDTPLEEEARAMAEGNADFRRILGRVRGPTIQRAELPPKEDVSKQFEFRQWKKGNKNYKEASGRLGHPDKVATHRNKTAQRSVSRGKGEDAGHLIGNRFGAPGGKENLNPQNWKANRYGTYKDLENAWAAKRRAGVEIDVAVTDVTREGEGRPFMRRVKWTETSADGTEAKHELEFANTHTAESRSARKISPATEGSKKGNVIHVDFIKKARVLPIEPETSTQAAAPTALKSMASKKTPITVVPEADPSVTARVATPADPSGLSPKSTTLGSIDPESNVQAPTVRKQATTNAPVSPEALEHLEPSAQLRAQGNLRLEIKQAAASAVGQIAVNLLTGWLQSLLDLKLMQWDLEEKQPEIEELLTPLMPKARTLWADVLRNRVFANITIKINTPTTYTRDVESFGGDSPITHYEVSSLKIISVNVSDVDIEERESLPSTQTYTEIGHAIATGADEDHWEQITYSVELPLGPKPQQIQTGPKLGTGAYAASSKKPLSEIDKQTHWRSKQQRETFLNDYLEFAKTKPELRDLYEQGLKSLEEPYQERPTKSLDPRVQGMQELARQRLGGTTQQPGTGAYAASQGKSLAEVDRSTCWKSEEERQQFINSYIRCVRHNPELQALYKRAVADYPLESWALQQ